MNTARCATHAMIPLAEVQADFFFLNLRGPNY